MFGPLLIVVGILFIVLTIVLFRLGTEERKLFKRAAKVIGEVVEVLPPPAPHVPETARIRFHYQGREYVAFNSPEWDGENNRWGAGYSVHDRVRLLVPPSCPQKAAPAVDVRNTVVGGPAVFAIFGIASLGFGTLLSTGSLLIGGLLIVAASVGMVTLLVYASFW